MASLKLPYYVVETLKSQVAGLAKDYLSEICEFLEVTPEQKKFLQDTVLKKAVKDSLQVYTIQKDDMYENEQKINSCPCPVLHDKVWDRCGYPCVNETYRCIHHQHVQEIEDCEPTIELTRIYHNETKQVYLCDMKTNLLYSYEGTPIGQFYPEKKTIVLYPPPPSPPHSKKQSA